MFENLFMLYYPGSQATDGRENVTAFLTKVKIKLELVLNSKKRIGTRVVPGVCMGYKMQFIKQKNAILTAVVKTRPYG